MFALASTLSAARVTAPVRAKQTRRASKVVVRCEIRTLNSRNQKNTAMSPSHTQFSFVPVPVYAWVSAVASRRDVARAYDALSSRDLATIGVASGVRAAA